MFMRVPVKFVARCCLFVAYLLSAPKMLLPPPPYLGGGAGNIGNISRVRFKTFPYL